MSRYRLVERPVGVMKPGADEVDFAPFLTTVRLPGAFPGQVGSEVGVRPKAHIAPRSYNQRE
jgi:hypothetical protein